MSNDKPSSGSAKDGKEVGSPSPGGDKTGSAPKGGNSPAPTPDAPAGGADRH